MKKKENKRITFISLFILLWMNCCTKTAYSQNTGSISVLKPVNISRMGIIPADYSGITYIGDDKYAIVDDKGEEGGISFLNIKMDRTNGKITDVTQKFVPKVRSKHKGIRDCEGVAYCKDTRSLFVSGEADQEIKEYDMDGKPTGRKLAIPQLMGKDRIQRNLGFESLTFNSSTKLFWTTTESVLKADDHLSSTDATKKKKEGKLRLQSFGLDLEPQKQYAYKMEKPQIRKKHIKTFVHGVSDMIALDNGDLIIMEREMCITKSYIGSYCTVRLFITSPTEYAEISNNTDMDTLSDDRFLEKSMLCEFTTYLKIGKMNLANYEGMCLGPKLNNGRQTIILINDSQKGAGNKFKRLKEYLKVITIP